MHKKPSVPSVHHIQCSNPFHDIRAMPGSAGFTGHPYSSPQCACLHNLAIVHWEGQQSTAQCLWEQTPFIAQGSQSRNGLVPPSHALVLPVPFCRAKHSRTGHHSNSIFKARAIMLASNSELYPLIIKKGNQVSTDTIWLLGQNACKKPVTINISC